jgi:hypothetical protein
MSGAMIMLVAWGLLIITHWANNKPAINAKQIVEMVVAILLIAFLDSNAETEPIAKGLAILFLVAILLSANSILPHLAKIASPAPSTPKKAVKLWLRSPASPR